MPIVTPNLDLPIRADADGELVCNEMDTPADFRTKAEVVMRYHPGDLSVLPEFGSPSLLGRKVPLDLSGVRNALAQWIPEGNYRVSESGDPGTPADRAITIDADEPSVGQ